MCIKWYSSEHLDMVCTFLKSTLHSKLVVALRVKSQWLTLITLLYRAKINYILLRTIRSLCWAHLTFCFALSKEQHILSWPALLTNTSQTRNVDSKRWRPFFWGLVSGSKNETKNPPELMEIRVDLAIKVHTAARSYINNKDS